MFVRNIAFAVLCCLTAVPAFAAGATVAELDDATMTIAKITLDTDGTLTVTQRDDAAKVVTMNVSPANLDNAVALARVLGQATITTDHRASVCLIELAMGGHRSLSIGQYDTVDQRFVGTDDHLVMSNDGCWNLTYTHPTDTYGVADGAQLETMLLTLANEAGVQ